MFKLGTDAASSTMYTELEDVVANRNYDIKIA
jgi:hypothetical protein